MSNSNWIFEAVTEDGEPSDESLIWEGRATENTGEWEVDDNGTLAPRDGEPVSIGEVNNTVRVRESDDLQAAINNATNGDRIIIEDGPNGRHDVGSTVLVDKNLTLDFRNTLVPTGDFPVMKTTAIVTIDGRGASANCFEDIDNHLTADSTDLVVFKAKVYTSSPVKADLHNNGAACFVFQQDDTEGSDNLNNCKWALWANRPGKDGLRFENVGASTVNLNAMRDCWAVCNLNTGARHGLNMVDGKRNLINGLTSGGDGNAFVDGGIGKNLWRWDWEGISDPTGPINSNLWLLNGSGWYTKIYSSNTTAGLESIALCNSGITLTLPDPPSASPGLEYIVQGRSGDESTTAVTITNETDGVVGAGSFNFTIDVNYGSAIFRRDGSTGNWNPSLGSA